MGERVQLKVQKEAQGFGHAVFLAHEFVGDEPFLLVREAVKWRD
jgi:UTP-glucose-1-phosphate uridylyltransferase